MKVMYVTSLFPQESLRFHDLAIMELLESQGHRVLSFPAANTHFHQQFEKLKTADLIVAEVTKQNMTVGYAIAEALKNNIPVLALTSEPILSPLTNFLDQSEQDLFLVHHYEKIRILEKELPKLLDQLGPKKAKKFNLFLSSELDNYLLVAAEKQSTSKSEYIRRLLVKDKKARP